MSFTCKRVDVATFKCPNCQEISEKLEVIKNEAQSDDKEKREISLFTGNEQIPISCHSCGQDFIVEVVE